MKGQVKKKTNRKVIGITDTIKEINKRVRLGEATVKEVLTSFLEVIKENLNEGRNIFLKNHFTLQRSETKSKLSGKLCSEHEKEIKKYKENSKGKGIYAFVGKDSPWSSIKEKVEKCNKCVAGSSNRVICKTSKELWIHK